MKQSHIIILLTLIFSFSLFILLANFFDLEFRLQTIYNKPKVSLKVKSIDTMKYSRDSAREKANDSSFDEIINRQIKEIAQTGATHVAIATPYDGEFVPFMKRWVKAARANQLNVWFRSNFSGWEGWFGYPKITREESLQKLEAFITNNPDLFENGDIFTPCAECENGSPGDPRLTGDVLGFRKFLVDQYRVSRLAFSRIDKSVASNFFSMNGDVVRLIMDKETTKQLGGIVVMDHYVKTPQKLAEDIRSLAQSSGGKVVLGEFGVPIPDINGQMDEEEQKKWLEDATGELSPLEDLIGVNYWVCCGGSTQLWNDLGEPRKAVNVIKKYYSR